MSENKSSISSLRQTVYSLLENLQVLEAISIVRNMLLQVGLSNYLNSLEKDRETFKYLLHYLVEGYPDGTRNKMIATISERLRTLADLAVRADKGKDSSDYYYSVLRFSSFKKDNFSSLLSEYSQVTSELALYEAGGNEERTLVKNKENLQERIFNLALTSLGEDNGFANIRTYLESPYADRTLTLLVISASTLSLLMYYDKSKFDCLLDVFENSDEDSVSARALVGIVLTLCTYHDRIMQDSEVCARLELWKDNSTFRNRLIHTLRMLIGTRDTERIASKIKDEVIPDLMKLRPELMDKFKGIDPSQIDPEDMHNNPEWEEILEKSGLSAKMQELNEMQNDGADLMMVTFSNLKQFPFFSNASNWFLPFDVSHSALDIPANMRSSIDLLASVGSMICDSDLYSLALALSKMPDMQRNMVMTQLQLQQQQMNDIRVSEELKESELLFKNEVQKSVRDLYRFFKLFRKKEGFFDPFSEPLKFYEMPVLGTFLLDKEVLEIVSEFYFKRGFYKDALPVLLLQADMLEHDATLWEKIGFCYQSTGNFFKALEAYEKASLLKTPGIWLLKKLAFVNKVTGRTEDAIKYYSAVLEKEPDNYSVIMNLGNLFLNCNKVEEALHQYYHANYIRQNSPNALRAIAWAELLNSNFIKSKDFYEKVIKIDPKESDYLNLGHVSHMLGTNKEALNYYSLAAEKDEINFKEMFMADLTDLEKIGYSRTEALLLLEAAMNK